MLPEYQLDAPPNLSIFFQIPNSFAIGMIERKRQLIVIADGHVLDWQNVDNPSMPKRKWRLDDRVEYIRENVSGGCCLFDQKWHSLIGE